MQPTGARPRSESAARRLWLCADDYGIAPGVNAAIGDLIGKRRLNATSVMVVAPSFNQEAAHALRELAQPAEVAIGLHITLTAPYRPLTSSYKPVREGLFLSLRHTLVRALVRRLDTAALAAEIAAQFDAFAAAFGQPPDFIDGHQHVHLLPQVRTAVLTAIAARAPGAWARQCGRARFVAGDPKAMLLDAFSRDFRRRAAAAGVSTNPAFAGAYVYEPRADFAALFPQFLHGLPDGGVVMCHPGFVDPELERLDPLTHLREREYAYLAGDEFPRALAQAHAVLH